MNALFQRQNKRSSTAFLLKTSLFQSTVFAECLISRVMRRNKHCKWQSVIGATVGTIGAVFLSQIVFSRSGINYGIARIVISMFPMVLTTLTALNCVLTVLHAPSGPSQPLIVSSQSSIPSLDRMAPRQCPYGAHGSSSGPLWTTWLNSCYAPMDHMA